METKSCLTFLSPNPVVVGGLDEDCKDAGHLDEDGHGNHLVNGGLINTTGVVEIESCFKSHFKRE